MHKSVKKILIILIIHFFIQNIQGQSFYYRMIQSVATAHKHFSAKLFKFLFPYSQQRGNLFISPFPIFNALAAIEMGTNESTRAEMQYVMGYFEEDFRHSRITDAFGFVRNITEISGNGNIKIITGIFASDELTIAPNYPKDVKYLYEADVIKVPFMTAPNHATQQINEYVSNYTHNRIPKVYENPLDHETQIIVAPTIFFNGLWINDFNESDTKNEPFYTLTDNASVPMMSRIGYEAHGYIPSIKAEALQMRYYGYNDVLTILLPYKNQSIGDMVEAFTNETFMEVEMYIDYKDIHIKVPRMNISWGSEIESHIEELGIGQIFNYHSEMTNMVTNIKTKITSVPHFVEFTLHEKGSGKSIPITKVPEKLPDREVLPPYKFFANKPFMFYVRNLASNVILFIGCVSNPTGVEIK